MFCPNCQKYVETYEDPVFDYIWIRCAEVDEHGKRCDTALTAIYKDRVTNE